MTKYKSPIKLGEKYRDERTGIEGHAVAVAFHATGCNEVALEWVSDKPDVLTGSEVVEKFFAEARLIPAGTPIVGEKIEDTVYKSDIKLDKQYTAELEAITGRAAYIEFHEHMAPRVAIQTIRKDAQDNTSPKTWMVDEYRLKETETQKPVKKKAGATGPSISEGREPMVSR